MSQIKKIFFIVYSTLSLIFFLQAFKLINILDVAILLGFRDGYILLGLASTGFLINTLLYTVFSKPIKYFLVKNGMGTENASTIVENWQNKTIMVWLVFLITIFSAGILYTINLFQTGTDFLNLYLFWYFASSSVNLFRKKIKQIILKN